MVGTLKQVVGTLPQALVLSHRSTASKVRIWICTDKCLRKLPRFVLTVSVKKLVVE